MAMLAIFLNRYRICLAEQTSIYTSKEVEPHRRSSNNSSRNNYFSHNNSSRSRSSNDSMKSGKLSLKDVKISNISTNSNSDIGMREGHYSFPKAADNKSSASVHSKTPSLEF